MEKLFQVDLCVWYRSSTHKDTGEMVNPPACGDCAGFNKQCGMYQNLLAYAAKIGEEGAIKREKEEL